MSDGFACAACLAGVRWGSVGFYIFSLFLIRSSKRLVVMVFSHSNSEVAGFSNNPGLSPAKHAKPSFEVSAFSKERKVPIAEKEPRSWNRKAKKHLVDKNKSSVVTDKKARKVLKKKNKLASIADKEKMKIVKEMRKFCNKLSKPIPEKETRKGRKTDLFSSSSLSSSSSSRSSSRSRSSSTSSSTSSSPSSKASAASSPVASSKSSSRSAALDRKPSTSSGRRRGHYGVKNFQVI